MLTSEEQIPNELISKLETKNVCYGFNVRDKEGLIVLGLKKAQAWTGGRQDSAWQCQHTSAGPCLPNPWPALQQTQPVGAIRAKWCGGFLMRLTGRE